MPRWFSTLCLLCLGVLSWHRAAWTTTLPAASCEEADVQAAINLAVDGDIVTVPAGTCQWTVQVSIPNTKGITLQAAGIDQTIIVDRVPKNTNPILTPLLLNTAGTRFTRVTGFTFDGSIQLGTGGPGFVQIAGSGKAWRIDHNKFYRLKTLCMWISGDLWGVVDNNTFDLASANCLRVFHGNWQGVGNNGHNSYATPHTMGTEQAVFVEDNDFTWTGPPQSIQAAFDPHGGARLVFRYNTISNGYMASHGTEAQASRAPRQWEVYNNTLSGNTFTNFFIRGGPGVVFNNVSVGYPSGPIVEYYRLYDDGGAPYGICDGRGPYDDNEPGGPFESGTVTGASGYTMTDTTKNWSAGQWTGYSVRNTTKSRSSAISSHTSNSITLLAPSNDPAWSWSVGDGYQLWKANRCLDQAGLGQGILYSGTNTSVSPQTWNSPTTEGLYFWNNTLDGAAESPVIRRASWQKLGTHIFTTAKPGYTPYMYPHPLRDDTPPEPPEEDELMGHWRLDETAGTTAADSTENANDGTLNGFTLPAAWIGGKEGHALRFDGVNDYVDFGDIPEADFGLNQDFTVLLWVRTTQTRVALKYPMFIQKHTPSGARFDWELYRAELGDAVPWYGSVVVNNVFWRLEGQQPLGDNQWHQLGLQREGTTIRLIHNGRIADSATDATLNASLANTGPLRLGRSNFASPNEYWFQGDIDDVRLYNVALSLDAIRDLYGTAHLRRMGRSQWRGGVTIAGD